MSLEERVAELARYVIQLCNRGNINYDERAQTATAILAKMNILKLRYDLEEKCGSQQ